MDKVWYFEPGDSACEDCQNAAGYYGSRPEGPHPGTCDCLIQEHDIESGNYECAREYRGVAASTSSGANATMQYRFDVCRETGGEITVESPIDVDDDLGSDLRDAMENILGWSAPNHVTETEFSVIGGHHGTTDVEAIVEVVTGSAEVWQICRVGDTKIERKVDDLIGTYSYVSAINCDVHAERCIY